MSEHVLTEAEASRQLADCLGAPVRVTVLNEDSRERRFRILGILSGIGPSGLVVDCLEVPQGASGASAALEVLVDSRLFWCRTTVHTGSGAERDRLFARHPETFHITQRRRFPRVDVEVQVHLVAHADRRVVSASMRDISAGGASMVATAPVAVGERVSVICSLGSGLYLSDLQAETLRCSDQGDGTFHLAVRFDCGPEQEAAISSWVDDCILRAQQNGEWSARA